MTSNLLALISYLTRSLPAATVVLALSAPLAAAPQVYADSAAACNGLTPCYSTITEAVTNAGPAPASVGIFPGTYAESIDLSTMGSAIGGLPGDITLQALDGAGQPIAGGVIIDPDASGGPGSGAGLSTGGSGPFAGDIILRGLTVTSPDVTAVSLILDGDLLIEDFHFETAAELGLGAVVDGDFAVVRGIVDLNGTGGMLVSASGQGTINDVNAIRNQGPGIVAVTEQFLVLDSLDSEFNETGLQVASCTTVDIANTVFRGNSVDGGMIQMGQPACLFMGLSNEVPSAEALINRRGSLVEENGSLAGAGTFITANNLTTFGNGNVGVSFVGEGAEVTLVDVNAYNNQSIGIAVDASEGVVELDGIDVAGNRTGIFVRSDSVDALSVVANASLLMPSNPPVDGSGLVVASRHAMLNDIQADDNPAAGLLLVQVMPGEPLAVELVDSQFADNNVGVVAAADVPIDFHADTVFLEGHASAGMDLSNLGTAVLAGLEVTGNGFGLLLDVDQSLRLETSSLELNGTGVALSVSSGAQTGIYCSDFAGNGDGLELVQGDTVDARNNFWGDTSGPTHPGNAGGNGDPVIDAANGGTGNVEYLPFLTGMATQDDCLTGIPEAIGVTALNGHGKGLLIVLFGLLGLIALPRLPGSPST